MSILQTAKVCAFIATRDREQAKAFYGHRLGFTLVSEDPYGVVFAMNDTSLRVTPVENFTALQHTVLGWNVADVSATVKARTATGITFERYAFLEQDALGIWDSGKAQVAWFKDLDGNVLSISSL
jgi:catechol 2,3-dioxygenase-like lactoylglutathione lyase family enzyme